MGVSTTGTKARPSFANRRRPDSGVTLSPIRDLGRIRRFATTRGDVAPGDRREVALRRVNRVLELQAVRLAGVLHDEASQFLATALMALGDLAGDVAPPVQARLQQVRLHLDEVAAQLRRVSDELHPGILDHLGLHEAIKYIAREFTRRTGVQLAIDADLDQPCPARVGTVVYRFVQEALTNIGEHAQATAASIAIARQGSQLTCVIRDDGVGFDLAAAAARNGDHPPGLVVIRDRLEALGGTLDITSAPQQGTRLCAVIPVEI